MNRMRLFYIAALLINATGLVYMILSGQWISLLAGVIVFNTVVCVASQLRTQIIVTRLLREAGINAVNSDKEHLLRTYLRDTTQTLSQVKMALSSIDDIGQNRFKEVAEQMMDGSMRKSLLSANEKIIELQRKDRENTWIARGVAALAEIKNEGANPHDYANAVLSKVVNFIEARQGGFFLLNRDDPENPFFHMVATYGYTRADLSSRRFSPGEGTIGQTFYERDAIITTEPSKHQMSISSGLGQSLPRSILTVPLLSEGNIFGAIEVASFGSFQPFQIEYLKIISENIAYTLSSIETNSRTQLLLEQSQKMAQEVTAQEEELRENMEQLTQAQEQMRKNDAEMRAVLTSLSNVELDLTGAILDANEIFLGITGYQLTELVGKLYKSLIPQQGNDPIQYEMMWSSIQSGRSFSGEFRIVNKASKEMWMVGNFTPILNDKGEPYKVMVISMFTTQDKEKLFELQETVAALKNCFPMAELNPDMTFKSANDLFLNEIGVRRIELKKVPPSAVLANGSYAKIEKYFRENADDPGEVELEIQNKSGAAQRFRSTLLKINNTNSLQRKGLVILKNRI